MPGMIERLRGRDEWKFLGVLPQADRTLAVAWWLVLVVLVVLALAVAAVLWLRKGQPSAESP